jgi:hypothetical protein
MRTSYRGGGDAVFVWEEEWEKSLKPKNIFYKIRNV